MSIDFGIEPIDFGLDTYSQKPRQKRRVQDSDMSLLGGLPDLTFDIKNTIVDTKRDYNLMKNDILDIRNELRPAAKTIKKGVKNLVKPNGQKFYVFVRSNGVDQRFVFNNFDTAQKFALRQQASPDVERVMGPVYRL